MQTKQALYFPGTDIKIPYIRDKVPEKAKEAPAPKPSAPQPKAPPAAVTPAAPPAPVEEGPSMANKLISSLGTYQGAVPLGALAGLLGTRLGQGSESRKRRGLKGALIDLLLGGGIGAAGGAGAIALHRHFGKKSASMTKQAAGKAEAVKQVANWVGKRGFNLGEFLVGSPALTGRFVRKAGTKAVSSVLPKGTPDKIGKALDNVPLFDYLRNAKGVKAGLSRYAGDTALGTGLGATIINPAISHLKSDEGFTTISDIPFVPKNLLKTLDRYFTLNPKAQKDWYEAADKYGTPISNWYTNRPGERFIRGVHDRLPDAIKIQRNRQPWTVPIPLTSLQHRLMRKGYKMLGDEAELSTGAEIVKDWLESKKGRNVTRNIAGFASKPPADLWNTPADLRYDLETLREGIPWVAPTASRYIDRAYDSIKNTEAGKQALKHLPKGKDVDKILEGWFSKQNKTRNELIRDYSLKKVVAKLTQDIFSD